MSIKKDSPAVMCRNSTEDNNNRYKGNSNYAKKAV